MNRTCRWFALTIALAMLGLGCEKLPGAGGLFAIGPLRFEMTSERMREAFAGREIHLDTNDTPRGQTYSVVHPFDTPPPPRWLTETVERASLTFWDNRLVRVRLHLAGQDLAAALAIKRRFDRGYEPIGDLSNAERLWLEYETPAMKVFLISGGDSGLTVVFVERAAYDAMDTARRRWKEQAAATFAIGGIRFGMTRPEVERVLGSPADESDFFAGLSGWRWPQDADHQEWILGFADEPGLAAIARLFTARQAPDTVQARIHDLTRDYGQGEMAPTEKGYVLRLDLGAVQGSVMVTDCTDAGCLMSEGWLWTGPPVDDQPPEPPADAVAR